MSALDAWEAWLMLTCVLLIACWAVCAVVERIALCRHQRHQITRIEPRCERAGSQAEFERRMRAGGAR